MAEYDLSSDELIAKDFRRLNSARRGFQPNGKREWIAAIKKFYRQNANRQAQLSLSANKRPTVKAEIDRLTRQLGKLPERLDFREHQLARAID